MTPEQEREILSAEAKAAAARIELAERKRELRAIESIVRRLRRIAGRKVKEKKARKPAARDLIRAHLAMTGKQRFTMGHIVRDLGITKSATQSALAELVARGEVVRMALGVYAPAKREAEAAE